MSPDRDRNARIRTSHAALGSSGRIVGKPYLYRIMEGLRVIRPRPFSLRVQMVSLIQSAQTYSLWFVS
jgi:hypothetical protein